jgi:hypothetical protein
VPIQEFTMLPPTEGSSHRDDDLELHLRVLAEYREMPGLRLTLTQAARLFDIEPTQCKRVLGTLVDAGCLATDGRQFATADGGRRSA